MIYEEALKQARDQQKANKAFLKTLKRLKPKNLDNQFHTLHEEAFEEIDCLRMCQLLQNHLAHLSDGRHRATRPHSKNESTGFHRYISLPG